MNSAPLYRRLAPSMTNPIVRLTRFAVTPTADATAAADAPSVSADFGDNSVGRDGNIFFVDGIQTSNFLRNPIVPYAHIDTEPPVGRVTSLSKVANQLRGTVEFTPADLYPFGYMVGRMYREGWLNAFSVSIIPLEFKYSTDRNRQGGIDVTKSDLTEISAVPVPALATALVTARSRGMDTSASLPWIERHLDCTKDRSSVAQLCAARKAAMCPPIFHYMRGF